MITDGQSEGNAQDEIEEISSTMNENLIKLNVIAIDFANDIGIMSESEQESACMSETSTQRDNKRILQLLISQIQGKIFPAKIAMDIYHQMRKKVVNPIAKYRGALEISKDLAIQVLAYSKTKAETIPSITKYSLVAEESKRAGEGKVKMDRVYCHTDDLEQKTIPAEDKIKGYYYGKQIVPILPKDEKMLVMISMHNILGSRRGKRHEIIRILQSSLSKKGTLYGRLRFYPSC